MDGELIISSVWMAFAASTLCMLLGGLSGFWLATLKGTKFRLVLLLTLLPLLLPPFLLVGSWIGLLGHSGWLRPFLPLELYSFAGTIWLLLLAYWPVSGLLAWSSLRSVDRSLLELDASLGTVGTLRHVIWPQVRSGWILGWLIAFVLCLNDFSIPVILQTKVFTTEVWLRFNTYFDAKGAMLLCWPLVVFPVLLMFLAWRGDRPGRERWKVLPNEDALSRSMAPGFRRMASMAWGLMILASVLLPLVELFVADHTWTQFSTAFRSSVEVAWTTLLVGCVSAILVSVIGWKLSRFRVGSVSFLFFFLPGVFVGMLLIALLNRPSTSWFYSGGGILILALLTRYLAVGWLGMRWLRSRLQPSLLEFADVHGAGSWQHFRHAVWPQVGGGALVVTFIVYLLCLWDAESIIMVVPAGGETLALRIFNLLHYGHNEQVNALCLILVGVGLLPLLLTWGMQKGRRFLPLAMVALLAVGCGGESSEETGEGSPLKSEFFSSVVVFGTRGVGPGEFNKPRSMTVDLEDRFYVVDMTGRVQKFSSTGEWLLAWQMPETRMGRPKGMCLDAEGRVVVVEPHYARVNHFSTDGELLNQWGVFGTEEGRLVFPRSVASDRQGRLIVSEYSQQERIQRFDASGQSGLVLAGGPERSMDPGGFNRPEGLGMDPEGRILVADSCNHRVQIFSEDGKWLRTIGGAGDGLGEMSFPYDVRSDAEGNLFVCEFGNSRIQIFGKDYEPIETIGGPGAAPGMFHNPWSLALDSEGNLYVADSQNHRIQKLIRRKGGASRVWFGRERLSHAKPIKTGEGGA